MSHRSIPHIAADLIQQLCHFRMDDGAICGRTSMTTRQRCGMHAFTVDEDAQINALRRDLSEALRQAHEPRRTALLDAVEALEAFTRELRRREDTYGANIADRATERVRTLYIACDTGPERCHVCGCSLNDQVGISVALCADHVPETQPMLLTSEQYRKYQDMKNAEAAATGAQPS